LSTQCSTYITEYTYVEAEYAYDEGKKIVLIRLEADCELDGWLKEFIGSKCCCDFSGDEIQKKEWKKLCAELKKSKRSGGDNS